MIKIINLLRNNDKLQLNSQIQQETYDNPNTKHHCIISDQNTKTDPTLHHQFTKINSLLQKGTFKTPKTNRHLNLNVIQFKSNKNHNHYYNNFQLNKLKQQ